MHTLSLNPLLLLSLLLVAVPAWAADTPSKPGRPPIFDEKADGAKQITDGLAQAKKANKRVLLKFGANWCIWCHRLHQLFQTDPAIAARLKESYVLVMIDVNDDHNAAVNERYGNPRRLGIPALLVLDSNGVTLATQNTGELEEGDHYDPAKVLAFLNRWAPPKR